jgi:hypothetical protein
MCHAGPGEKIHGCRISGEIGKTGIRGRGENPIGRFIGALLRLGFFSPQVEQFHIAGEIAGLDLPRMRDLGRRGVVSGSGFLSGGGSCQDSQQYGAGKAMWENGTH